MRLRFALLSLIHFAAVMARETLALQRDIQRHLRADGAWTDPALGPGNESRKLCKTRGLNGICCSPAQVPWLGASSLDSGFQLDPVRKAQWRASVPASRALVQAHGRSKTRTSATSCSIHAHSLQAARETLALQCVIAGLDIVETLFGRGLPTVRRPASQTRTAQSRRCLAHAPRQARRQPR